MMCAMALERLFARVPEQGVLSIAHAARGPVAGNRVAPALPISFAAISDASVGCEAVPHAM